MVSVFNECLRALLKLCKWVTKTTDAQRDRDQKISSWAACAASVCIIVQQVDAYQCQD